MLDAIPDARTVERLKRKRERYLAAGQWTLIWRRFRRHTLGLIGGAIAVLIYLIAIFAEFLAPTTLEDYTAAYRFAPPMPLEIVHVGADGAWQWGLHTHPLVPTVDKVKMRRTLAPDPRKLVPVGFFVPGEPYRFWGLFPTDIHLIGTSDPKVPLMLLGSDRLGRDLLSRIIYGARISLSIGLFGVAISFALGVVIGGISGYLGGVTDNLIQLHFITAKSS